MGRTSRRLLGTYWASRKVVPPHEFSAEASVILHRAVSRSYLLEAYTRLPSWCVLMQEIF